MSNFLTIYIQDAHSNVVNSLVFAPENRSSNEFITSGKSFLLGFCLAWSVLRFVCSQFYECPSLFCVTREHKQYQFTRTWQIEVGLFALMPTPCTKTFQKKKKDLTKPFECGTFARWKRPSAHSPVITCRAVDGSLLIPHSLSSMCM